MIYSVELFYLIWCLGTGSFLPSIFALCFFWTTCVPASITLCVGLWIRIASTILWLFGIADSWLNVSLVTALYYAVGEILHRRGALYSPALRRSRLAKWLGRSLARIDFDEASRAKIAALDPTETYVFAGEPHGISCLWLALCFCAHGGLLPDEIASKTFCMGNWTTRLVPLVRDLYSAVGMIDNSYETFQFHLRQGHSIALIPSAVKGKVADYTEAVFQPLGISYHQKSDITFYRRISNRAGFMKLAAVNKSVVIPILSGDEASIWKAGDSILTSFFDKTRKPLEVAVGEPILPASESEDDVSTAVDYFYRSLGAMATEKGVSWAQEFY